MSRRHRRVWVVMRNDYPCAVFSNEDQAVAYCNSKTEQDIRESRAKGKARIYGFNLDDEAASLG